MLRRVFLPHGGGRGGTRIPPSHTTRDISLIGRLQVWHTSVPVWALLLSVSLPIVYVLPSGFIYAMTGQGVCVLMHSILE